MSKRMEGAPQMSPQGNEWVSREEYDELRDHTNSLEAKVDNLSAQIAEMQRTQQLLLEKIGDIRKEDVEQKDSAPRGKLRSKLGAVAMSAAAFFGRFFHRGEDLGDFHDEKEHSKGAKNGAHAKDKEKKKGNTPIVSARRGEKSKNSREQEDKPNKNKTSGIGKKIVAGALALALVAGGAVAAFSPHKNAQDLPQNPTNERTVDMNNLRVPEIEQALAEQDAEAARQQQLAETMGMSVEEMHAVADRHGVNHNDIGTAKAHDQMRDNMESDYNLSEKIDLENMSEAERSERSKQEILFANMNNKYVTAQISSARLGAHDASDSELTRQLFEQYEENDAVWQEQAKENAKFLEKSTYSTRLAGAYKTHTYGTERQWDGPIEDQYVLENSGGETVYIIEVANGDIKIQFKDGCIQAVWVEEVAQPRQQVKERTVVQREVVQKEEHQENYQENRQPRQYSWERRGGEIEHRQNDSKDPKANDTQQNADKSFEDDSKANNNAPTYGGQKNPDASAKSGNTDNNPDNGSEVTPDDKNGSIGGRQDVKPGQQDWDGGAADNGQDKTTANPSDQGGSGKDTAGGNQTDSGSGSKETGHKSSSQHRSSEWTKGGSETIDENGNATRKSYSSASDTGWVNDDDTHSGGNQAGGNQAGGNQAGGDVELQNIVVPGV